MRLVLAKYPFSANKSSLSSFTSLRTLFRRSFTHHQEMVVEGLLLPLAKGILEILGSLLVKEIALPGFEDELESLMETVSVIIPVLEGAEEHQAWNREVKKWLELLSDRIHDVDDLLDAVSTDAVRQEKVIKNKISKKVRELYSKPKQLAYGRKMAGRIRKVRRKLANIAANKEFLLEKHPLETKDMDSYSFVLQEEVTGRECEKEDIIKILMNSNVEEKASVLPIVGKAGLGKTTLAHCICNDKRITDYFKPIRWVRVSYEFDVQMIILDIIGAGKSRSHKTIKRAELVNRLQSVIGRKRYLIVLDDVWNEDKKKWSDLESLLKFGGEGSKILLTTRTAKVAKITTRTFQPYYLKVLDPLSSWNMVIHGACKYGQGSLKPQVVDNSKTQILRICQGVPQALIIAGEQLSSIDNEEQCSLFVKNDLTGVLQDECGMASILKPDYDRLPLYLKYCFIYFSLFPYDHKICKTTLIDMWISQGFIKSLLKYQCLEDVGHRYFMELVEKSFFHETIKDDFDDIVECKLEQFMHGLAISVAGSLITIVRQKEDIGLRTRHISIGDDIDFSSIVSKLSHRARRMRTVFCPQEKYEVKIDCKAIFSKLKFVRALDLHGRNLSFVPKNIGKLKHLRYLDLSKNNQIKELPKSITKLPNLQTLRLSDCESLEKLPRNIQKLANLKHLKIDGCKDLTYMPSGLEQLTDLQTLSTFVVDSGHVSKHSGGLNELEKLNNLRGQLQIRGLSHAESVALDYKVANLKNKSRLRSLELRWIIESDVKDSDASVDKASMDGFQPHQNLKQLLLEGYRGSGLSDWLSLLNNLAKLQLVACKNCKCLLPLSQLPFLKCLELTHMDVMQYISDCGYGNLGCASLKELHLDNCPNLKGWWDGDCDNSFPCLLKLDIRECPELTSMLMFPLLEELFLENTSFKPLEQTMKMRMNTLTAVASSSSAAPLPAPLLRLKHLKLDSVKKLETLPDGGSETLPDGSSQTRGLQNLISLKVSKCESLKVIPYWICNCKSLEKVEIVECSNLTATPGVMDRLKSLQLTIQKCPNLEDWPIPTNSTAIEPIKAKSPGFLRRFKIVRKKN